MIRIALSGFAAFVVGMAPVLHGADLVKAKDGSGVFGYKDTPRLPWCGYVMHDPDRPLPPKVQVGPPGAPVLPPSDAVILFDGKDLSAWQPSKWKVEDSHIVATEGKLAKPARITALQNGVLIHLNQEIYGETRHRVFPAYKQTNSVAPISLPAHYCPVRFRNIWARPLK